LSTELQSQTDYADQCFTRIDLERSELVSCQFHHCEFVRCSLVETIFRDCRLVDCIFREYDLSLIQAPGTSFSAVRFEGSKVIGVDWTRADWTGVKLGNPIAFSKCAISHSTFIGLSLAKLQLVDCVATDVDFREADLSQADFAGTDLHESLFSNTNLTGADLSCARNYHIAPGRNVLTGAKFSLPEAMSLLYNLDIDLLEDDLKE